MKLKMVLFVLIISVQPCFSQNANAFEDLRIALGRKISDTQNMFGNGDHFPSNPTYTRSNAVIKFYPGEPSNSRYKGLIVAAIVKVKPTKNFVVDSLLNENFLLNHGIKFPNTCKSGTVVSDTEISITYRNCSAVKSTDKYVDTSKFYYELKFLGRKRDLGTELVSISIILKHDLD